ncbi:hypothetical protein SprV_0802538700 [Sparganum proliferum]
MEQLADVQKLDATKFKQLLLQRLPPSVQAILAPNTPSSTVQMLAETADRILEYYQHPLTVNAASRSTIAPTIEDAIKGLDALTLEVSQLRSTRLVGRRRTTPSFEITDITSTCIYFKWGHPPYEAALKHFILQGTAVDSNKTVEIRFAATEREGFLCNLEPSTYYATSLISVTGVHVPPVKVDLKKVSTRSADSSSRGPTAVLDTTVSDLAEELATDSNSKLNNHNSTKTPETKTVKSTPQSQEDRNQTSPTPPSESDGQGLSESTPGFSTSADILPETMIVNSDDEGDDKDSSGKQGSKVTASTIPTESIKDGIVKEGAFWQAAIAIIGRRSCFSTSLLCGAPEPISSHNDSVRTLTKSEYIETKIVELQTQSNIGTLQEEGIPPAAIIVTVFGILSLSVLVIGITILLIRRRRRMRQLKLNIAMVDSDDVDSKISSDF